MGIPASSTFDSQMMGNSNLLQRRASASPSFGNQQVVDFANARRMSPAGDQGSINQAGPIFSASVMGFQLSQQQLKYYTRPGSF